jgi:hypothetical protein
MLNIVNLHNSIQALIEYSEKHGFPTAREWAKYAKENNFLDVNQLLYYTKKRWSEIRKELGFEKELKIKRQQKFEHERQLAIQQLQDAAKTLGKDFTRREYIAFAKEKGYFTVGQLARLFNGKFNNAKLATNLPVHIADDKFSNADITAAIKDCSKFYNDRKFSEYEYEEWRKQEKIKRPHIETIRKRLGSLPELKMMLSMDTYEEHEAYDIHITEEYCFSVVKKFITEMLSIENYEKWAKSNNMPTLRTIEVKTKKSWEELKNLR